MYRSSENENTRPFCTKKELTIESLLSKVAQSVHSSMCDPPSMDFIQNRVPTLTLPPSTTKYRIHDWESLAPMTIRLDIHEAH